MASIADVLEYGCTCLSHDESCAGRRVSFPEEDMLKVIEDVGMSLVAIQPESFPSPDLNYVFEMDRFSPGEKSRLLIARLLLWKPVWAVLDETFGAIDQEGRRVLVNLLWDSRISLIVVDHGDLVNIGGEWKLLQL